ncbi:MAG: hypothetical protein JWN67_4408 [Actinomycetia bacterium]|nr:hypothetical protein [Actinomycetes bacterium]
MPMAWPLVGRADELEQALESLASARGAVLSGVAGVGKSRLAAEALEQAAALGWATVSVAAGAETVAAPFSPFASLLAGDHSGDHVARFLRAARVLTAQGERVVVAIDDAQLLDEVSVAFVRHLLTSTSVRVLLTVRSGGGVPSTLVTLWQAGMLRRIELLALAREETEHLAGLVLEGPVHQAARRWVWETTRGNALFVHELVLDATERGALVPKRGRWTLSAGVNGAGSRLQEVVAARVGSLTPEERVAVELLALGQPLGLATIEALAGEDVVAKLEQRGLLAVRADRRRNLVRLAHPLHGEVVRATMSVTAGRARRRQLIDAVSGRGARRDVDAVRLALWRCEIGEVDDWEPLLRAAEELASAGDRTLLSALHGTDGAGFRPTYGHLEQAVVLARGAFDGGRSVAAAALLFRLLTLLGREDEAAAVHDEAVGLASGEADELLLVRMRAVDVFFGHGDAPPAQTLLRAFADRASDPDVQVAASASLAMVTALSGTPEDALALAHTVIDADGGARGDRLLGLAAAAIGLGEAGRIGEALAMIDDAFAALVTGDRNDLVVSVSLVRTLLLACDGRMAEAEELVRSCYGVAAGTDDVTSMGVFAALAAHLALERGHADRAAELAAEAAGRLVDVDAYGLRHIARALRVHAAAVAGSVDDAVAARLELDAVEDASSEGSEGQRARAWLDVADGRVSIAVGRLEAAAETQAQAGRVMREAAALHDLVRLGHPQTVTARLHALAVAADSAVVSAMARQADAAAEGDAEGLAAVAEAWSSMDYDLFAAEAFAQTARMHEEAGRMSSSAAARRRSQAAAARCGRVATPGLLVSGPAATLTRRESEIAGLAARGLADRQIADELVVSVRTVQSHLYNAYAKLGVDGRAGLVDLLGD